MVTSTNMSFDVLPTIRKKPMLEWRMASDTARFAALVESLPWTSTPMPISVIQRTRAIWFLFFPGYAARRSSRSDRTGKTAQHFVDVAHDSQKSRQRQIGAAIFQLGLQPARDF